MKDRMGNELSTKQVFYKGINRMVNICLDFELMILRWVGYIPIHGFRNFCYKLAGIKFGKNSTFHMWANFYEPKNISIEEGTIIGNNAFLDVLVWIPDFAGMTD